MNQLADRLRDTEADLKQAREAFEFKCDELKQTELELKKTREALARERRINETREEAWNRLRDMFWEKMLTDSAIEKIVERMFKK